MVRLLQSLMRKGRLGEMWSGAPLASGIYQTQTSHRLRMQLAAHSGVSVSLPISTKVMKMRENSPAAAGVAFLDSETPNHYGPRGFKQGRRYLGLLATPQCPRRGF